MKKFLLWLVAVLFLAVIWIPIVILWSPHLLINGRNLDRARDFLERKGIHVEWSEREIRVENLSALRKKINLSLSDFCYKNEPSMSACFKSINLSVIVRLPKTIEQIDLLQALGGKIALAPVKADEEKEKPSGKSPLRFFEGLVWNKVKVEIDELKYKLPAGNLEIKGILTGSGDGDKLNLSLKTSGGMDSKNNDLDFNGDLNLEAGVPLMKSPFAASLGGVLNTNSHELKISAKVSGEKNEPGFEFDLKYKNTSNRLSAGLIAKGRLLENEIKSTLFGVLEQKRNLLRVRKEDPCVFAVSFRGDYDISCPFRVPVNPDLMKIKLNVPVPDTIGLALKTKFRNAFPPDLELPFEGDAYLKLLAIETDALRAEGKSEAGFKFKVSELPHFEKLKTVARFNLKIPKFEKFVEELRRTKFAIPAPFHTLTGPITVDIKDGTANPELVSMPFQWFTDLSGDSQQFKTKGTGLFTFDLNKKIPKLQASASLSDIRVVIPRMEWRELSEPPKVIPDSRIKKEFEETAAPSKFDYEIKIKTESPVQFISNLAAQPVPVSANLSISKKESFTGDVSVSEFPLILFKRNAKLDFLKITFREKEEDDLISGRAIVAYTDYTIFIKVGGLLNKPRVELESSPPVPNDQLIATLIYGRPLNELDSDQRASVKNLEAALKDGVLGYASMYYLASTPIESIGYDSRSKMITAKIRLREGTSLNLGLNEHKDLGVIGIRRRLGRNWVITTEVADPMERGARNVSAFLEWLFRY